MSVFSFLQRLLTMIFFVFLLTPAAVVAWLFFRPGNMQYLEILATRLYNLSQRQDLVTALFKSLKIGAISSTIATVIAILTTMAFKKDKFFGKKLLLIGTALPLIMPELVLAVGSLVWFSLLQFPLDDTTVITSHVTLSVSFCILILRARFQNHDDQLEEAAKDLGATSWQVFYRVTAPLLMPGIIAAWLVAFNLSFDDFVLAFFLSGPGSETLPVKLYNLIRFGVPEEVFTLSFFLIIFASFLVCLLYSLGKNSTIQAFKA